MELVQLLLLQKNQIPRDENKFQTKKMQFSRSLVDRKFIFSIILKNFQKDNPIDQDHSLNFEEL
jgi:hypothetical protein